MNLSFKKQIPTIGLAFLLAAGFLCGCSNAPSDNTKVSLSILTQNVSERSDEEFLYLINDELLKISPEQIAAMPLDEQKEIRSLILYYMSDDQRRAIKGEALTADQLNAILRFQGRDGVLESFTPKQIAAMPLEELKKIRPVTLYYMSDDQRRAIKGEALTADHLNAILRFQGRDGVLESFTSEQIAAMPLDEQKEIRSLTLYYMSDDQRRAIKGEALTADHLNKIPRFQGRDGVLESFTPEQIAAMLSSEKKKLDKIVLVQFSDEQRRSLVIAQIKLEPPTSQFNVK